MRHPFYTREFHVSRDSRQKYGFHDLLFSLSGNVIFANYHAARVFTHQLNQKRDLISYPEQALRASDLYAMGLIDEILHYIVQLYSEQVKSTVMKEALVFIRKNFSTGAQQLLQRFISEFPPLAVHRGTITVPEYFSEPDNPEIALEEMILLWLANRNPAFDPFSELFDETILERSSPYRQIFEKIQAFFKSQPPFGPDGQTLIEMLRAPALASPYSLTAQLDFIRSRWGYLISDRYLYKLLSSLDYIREENRARGMGSGIVTVPDYSSSSLGEPERFSPDKDWMPNVVLIAKNAYVWLNQLSRQTGQTLNRLDQIPDETLDQLSGWGFTALWLIGIWERSPASKRIKQMCGNPEAEASAYALYDYQVAGDLGGETAFQNLKSRAWQRGIRLSGDMVPNHVGIDGRWVIQHPDWFISLPYSPYPSYTFHGPDLSHDERVGIYLEDHYYTRTDAAVVFKRRDHWTGDERYIYHGNDGTSMPWNDTAQLNFLNPEVREAVIQTILHVARQFPIIRFDAAMTLTQKHFQRLWFPEPGHGGDIASRSEHGITREQFLEAIPYEFWREVVDRVAEEAPDTLLLAEAFWLLEGYFVRSLGMHRVYNSAFMNMLKTENNAGYRDVIRKTLEFNPEILKRFVNFMNNPDEDTAVAQFGKDDKYFGSCLLMVTLPGLPMFGHGQIEGFTEKYGMEYRQAYWDEIPDEGLVRRHERQVFPVLLKRYLFAEVTEYCLYDVVTPEGHVNGNIFAHSNRKGDECALYIYHNRWAESRGWIRRSVTDGRSLGEGLGLSRDESLFTIFRDHISGLEYIRRNSDFFESGLFVELGAFKYHLFWEFRQVYDEHGSYHRLSEMLNGRGVPSIEDAIKEMGLRPILDPMREWLESGLEILSSDAAAQKEFEFSDSFSRLTLTFFNALKARVNGSAEAEMFTEQTLSYFHSLLRPRSSAKSSRENGIQDASLSQKLGILGWLMTSNLGRLVNSPKTTMISRSWIDEFMMGKIIAQVGACKGLDETAQWESVSLMKLLVAHPMEFNLPVGSPIQIFNSLFSDYDAQTYLQINRYQDVLYFNRERFRSLVNTWFIVNRAVISDLPAGNQVKARRMMNRMRTIITRAENQSQFRVDSYLKELEQAWITH
jgi:glycosidase